LRSTTDPEAYIRAAFNNVGLSVSSVEVVDYAPEVFGNLIAEVSSSVGNLTAIYDREFILRAPHPLPSGMDERLKRALEEAKREVLL
jgi:hypothetical protein